MKDKGRENLDSSLTSHQPYSILDHGDDRFASAWSPDAGGIGADLANGGFFGSHIDKVFVFGANQGPQLDPIVKSDQPLIAGKENGKGPVQERTAVDLANGGVQLTLVIRELIYQRPERRSQSGAGQSGLEAMLADQKVEHVGNHLGVGQH